MATFNTSQYSKQIGSAGASPSAGYPLSKDVAGHLRYAVVTYSLAGTEAAADVINLTRRKVGSKIIPSLCRVVCEDPGTALTLDFGFASDPDALANDVALTTAHDVAFTAGTAVPLQYVPADIASGDEVITATVVTATALTAGAKLLFLIAFVDE